MASKKKVILLICLLGSLLGFTQLPAARETAPVDLTPEEKQWLQAHGTLEVTAASMPPYAFTENGKVQGYTIGLLEKMARQIGATVAFTLTSMKKTHQAIKDGQAQIILNQGYTKQKEEYLSFSGPFVMIKFAIFSKKGRIGLNDLKSLKGKTVAGPPGYFLFAVLKKKYPNIKTIHSKNLADALRMVSDDQADAAIMEQNLGQYLIAKHFFMDLHISGFAKPFGDAKLRAHYWAVAKDFPVLKTILDKAFKSLSVGEKQRLWDQWFQQSDPHDEVTPDATLKLELTKEEKAWLASHKKIVVGGETDWAPFDYVDKDGRYAGIANDYLKIIGEKLGVEWEIITGPTWNELLAMIRQKEIDVLPAIYFAKDREAYLSFTNPYLKLTEFIFSRSDAKNISGFDDLKDKTIVVVKGYTIENELRSNYPEYHLITAPTIQDALKKLITGEADAFIGDVVSTYYNIHELSLVGVKAIAPVPFQGPDVHMATRKDWPMLVNLIDKALNAIPQSQHAAIKDHWISYAERKLDEATPEIRLTPQEQAFLKKYPVIRVHNEKGWAPFNYFEYGSPKGLSIDYMDLLAERLGIRIKYITGPNWNAFLQMIRKKDLDVMLNIVKTEDREKYILYTEPYAKNPNTIVSTRKKPYENIEQLFGKTVAFPKGFFYEEVLTKSFPEIKRLPVLDTLASLKAVSLGKAAAALGEQAVVRNLIIKNMLSDLYISGEVELGNPDLTNLRIGIRDDWPLFQTALMKAMAHVAPSEMNQLRQKWLSGIEVQPVKTLEAAEEMSLKSFLIYGLIIFLTVCLLSWILIRSIKREDIAINFGSSWFRGFVLAGLSVFVIIVALLGWYTLERQKKLHLKDVEGSLRGILSITQDRLDLWLEERLSYLARLGRDPALVAMTKNLLKVDTQKDILLKSEALRKMRAFFKESKDIFPNIGFFIINPEHVSIGSMRDANIGTPNLISDQHPELLKRAFEGKVGFVPPITSDVFLGNTARSDKGKKPPTMFFIGPVQDADGRVLAVMTLRVNPWKDFARAMKTFGEAESREIYAFDRNGVLLSISRFEDQLRRIGLLSEDLKSALNIEIRDPGGNMLQGYRPERDRSQQPLTYMAAAVLGLRQKMEKAGIHQGHSPVVSNTVGYRDYRGVRVFGAWLWNEDLNVGLAVEIDVNDALAQYNRVRITVYGILGFTLLLSVGSVLLLLLLGERSSRALIRARDGLEEKVAERTSELKENEGRLAEAEERSRLLLNSAGDGIFGVDTDGKTNFINPAATRMLGFSEDELIGKNVHAVIHHSHADGSLYPVQNCPMYKAFTEGTSHHVDNEVLWRKDGTHFPVEYASTPMEKDGKLVGAVITFKDITERKAAEERFTALLESAPDAMVVSDETGSIVLVNSQAETVFGYSREELIGNNVDMLVPEEVREAHPDKRASFYADPKRLSMGFRGNFFGISKDGQKIPIDVGLSPIETEEGLLVVASIRDITERREMEAALASERERLQEKLEELTRFRRLAIGREHRMIELKKEINRQLTEKGNPEKYKIH